MMFLILLLALIPIYFLLRRNYGTSHSSPDALEILKVRYARGELTKEEYERMKQDLGG